MDLLAKERVLSVLIWCAAAATGAQAAEGVYPLDAVDYFALDAAKKPQGAPSSVWLDPGYRPPQVVVDLLQEPNEGNARKYLEWNRARLAGIARAQRAVDRAEILFPGEVCQ